jgi:DNA end-binding protein Ku
VSNGQAYPDPLYRADDQRRRAFGDYAGIHQPPACHAEIKSTRPVALYPATSESEKITFNQLNRKTGRRIKYAKVDADTGEEVANEDIVKGYKVDTDTFVEVTREELENVALESTRTIEIDEFVDRTEIDPRYLIRPYYLRPDGKVGHDAFAVIREMNKVAIGRVVLTNREHIIALEPMDKGLMGTLLRYPYEVRELTCRLAPISA